MIYLVSPYSHASAEVREQRYKGACVAAAKLMGEGRHVFSPIVHTHPLVSLGGLGRDWEYWHEYDLWLLRHCEEVVVLRLEGWEHSAGCRQEIEEAMRLGLPVSHMDLENAQ